MPVDSIRYCLERATDAIAFEALCCDILSCDGYAAIEPLGGTGDGGRDALYGAGDALNAPAVCAYSLRKDWKAKLRHDCERIQEKGHACSRLVFVFILQPTPNERDAAIAEVKRQFGWELELYGLERLRVQLASRSNHLLSAYPTIFNPRFFATVGGEFVEKEQRDLLLIDHVENDLAFASWLSRRLEISGYSVCCTGIAPFAGSNVDGTIRTLINRRAAKYIPVLSTTALTDENLRGRCEAAASIENCLLPVCVDTTQFDSLSKRVAALQPCVFSDGWASGLSTILRLLAKQGVPQSWDVQSGRVTALDSIIPEPLTNQEPETLYSNAFSVLKLPTKIFSIPLSRDPNPAQVADLRAQWPFVLAGSTALSFHYPPEHELIGGAGRFGEALHEYNHSIAGRLTRDVLCELIRRCVEFACYRRGLLWCPDRELIYFSSEGKDSRRISYVNAAGKKISTGVTGKKSLFRPGPQPNEVYRYAVAPKFFASNSSEKHCWEVRLRLFLRITDESGKPHSGRAVTTRRKAAAAGWFNQHWFAKTLATIQHIGDDAGQISVGEGEDAIVISTTPKAWSCPVSIDTDALERMMEGQKATRHRLQKSEETDQN